MGKRGPKKLAGKRERNGQLSRKQVDRTARVLDGLDADQRDTLAVGIEARVRVHGVEPRHSRDQMAGSFIGRLCITGDVSRVQYDAAMTWQEDAHNYSIALRSPRQPGAVDLNRTQGTSTDHENVAFVARAKARYEAAARAVQEKQNELRGQGALFAALHHVVIRDLELMHMVPDCRVALNALAKHYGLESRSRAA